MTAFNFGWTILLWFIIFFCRSLVLGNAIHSPWSIYIALPFWLFWACQWRQRAPLKVSHKETSFPIHNSFNFHDNHHVIKIIVTPPIANTFSNWRKTCHVPITTTIFIVLILASRKVTKLKEIKNKIRVLAAWNNCNNRDLKHRRRRAQRTTTGGKISPYCATAHARLVVHMKFRTSERQVCRPERTWVCIYVFTECLR